MAVKRRRAERRRDRPSGDLSRLVAAEERLAARLREARAEAARIVAEARTRRERAESDAEAVIAEATRELEATAARERARRLAALRDDARRRAERFDRVTDDEVAALAERSLDRLLAEDAQGPP